MKKLLRHFFAGSLIAAAFLNPNSGFAQSGTSSGRNFNSYQEMVNLYQSRAAAGASLTPSSLDAAPGTDPCTLADLTNTTNLVANGSFEFNRGCPNGYSWVTENLNTTLPCGWTSPLNPTYPNASIPFPISGSSDYFLSNATCNTSFGTASALGNVDNGVGRQAPHQWPHNATNNAYAGIITFDGATHGTAAEWREYLRQGIKPLKPNRQYYGELFVSSADNVGFDCNSLGMLLTNGAPAFHSSSNPGTPTALYAISGTPQIQNTAGFITNTTGWTKISGTFQTTSGGENFLTIGNFNNVGMGNYGLPNATAQASNRPAGGNGAIAYNYIDDVALYEVPYAGANVATCAGSGQSFTLGSGILLPAYLNPTYTWKLNGNIVSSSNTSFNYAVTPTQTQVYTLEVTIYDPATGITSLIGSSSVGVTVNSKPANFSVSGPATICQGTATTLTASVPFFPFQRDLIYSWQGGGQTWNTNIVTVSPGTTTTYTATVTNSKTGCSDTKTVTITVNPAPTPIYAGNDVTICPGQGTQLQATGGTGAISYTWSPATGLNTTSGLSVIANPMYNTTYTVTATGANGCSTTDQVTVNVHDTGYLMGFYQSKLPGSIDPNTGDYLFDVGLAEGGVGINSFCYWGMGTGTKAYITLPNNGSGTWLLDAKSAGASFTNGSHYINGVYHNIANITFKSVNDWIDLVFSYQTACGTQYRYFQFSGMSCRLSQPTGSPVINAYPNPAHESLTLEGVSGSTYKLYNNKGVEVANGTLTGEKTKVNTADLKKGLYFLHVQNGKKTEKQQIVIE